MVDSNDSFLREVKEEIDRERLENLWKRYGTLILGAAALLIVSVIGFQTWGWMAKTAAEQAGAEYQKALQSVLDGKLGDADGIFAELSKDAPTGYATLAGLQVAATLIEQGKTAEARKKFDELSKRSGVDSLLSGFAALQAASLRLGEADFTEMQNRLNDLTRVGSPWRFNAHELLGMAALKAGKLDVARRSFTTILGDGDAPPAMRQRADFRMAQVAASEGKAKAETVKGNAEKSVGSENTKPEATKSEAGKPEVTKPEADKSEPTKPEAANSEEPADANK